jgi:hypothetical protein
MELISKEAALYHQASNKAIAITVMNLQSVLIKQLADGDYAKEVDVTPPPDADYLTFFTGNPSGLVYTIVNDLQSAFQMEVVETEHLLDYQTNLLTTIMTMQAVTISDSDFGGMMASELKAGAEFLLDSFVIDGRWGAWSDGSTNERWGAWYDGSANEKGKYRRLCNLHEKVCYQKWLLDNELMIDSLDLWVITADRVGQLEPKTAYTWKCDVD